VLTACVCIFYHYYIFLFCFLHNRYAAARTNRSAAVIIIIFYPLINALVFFFFLSVVASLLGLGTAAQPCTYYYYYYYIPIILYETYDYYIIFFYFITRYGRISYYYCCCYYYTRQGPLPANIVNHPPPASPRRGEEDRWHFDFDDERSRHMSSRPLDCIIDNMRKIHGWTNKFNARFVVVVYENRALHTWDGTLFLTPTPPPRPHPPPVARAVPTRKGSSPTYHCYYIYVNGIWPLHCRKKRQPIRGKY